VGVRLSEDEAWARIAASHTGILTSLRADGWPVALPVWFAVEERTIYVRTPPAAAKLKRIRRDPRCGFLVEAGESWAELAAVSLQMRGTVLDREGDAEEAARAMAMIEARYAGNRTAEEKLPGATLKHYAERLVIRLEPTGPMVSWDNSRIRLREEG
jgi:PPOX class probable F420-dependent enzyme